MGLGLSMKLPGALGTNVTEPLIYSIEGILAFDDPGARHLSDVGRLHQGYLGAFEYPAGTIMNRAKMKTPHVFIIRFSICHFSRCPLKYLLTA